ncbi:UNVERIFIED_CONTAM: hypothetical protein FKN15_004331 [Acipenser sinensis]
MQRTLSMCFNTTTTAQRERLDVVRDWVLTCAAANIPLSKTDHPFVCQFLNTRVKNGGAIPGGYQLQDASLTDVYKTERNKLKDKLKDKNVSVIFDEMTDDEGRYVLNILLVPLVIDGTGKVSSYLADTHFMQKTNHSTVSQAVIQTVQSYEIAYKNVIVSDTDMPHI